MLSTIKLSFFIFVFIMWQMILKVFFCLRINYDVACPMDFRKYPYDTQTCKVKYESCKFWQKLLIFALWFWIFLPKYQYGTSVGNFFDLETETDQCFFLQ